LDDLPSTGNEHGRAFRDLELEQEVLNLTHKTGIGIFVKSIFIGQALSFESLYL
jgi:hypothetical protein